MNSNRKGQERRGSLAWRIHPLAKASMQRSAKAAESQKTAQAVEGKHVITCKSCIRTASIYKHGHTNGIGCAKSEKFLALAGLRKAASLKQMEIDKEAFKLARTSSSGGAANSSSAAPMSSSSASSLAGTPPQVAGAPPVVFGATSAAAAGALLNPGGERIALSMAKDLWCTTTDDLLRDIAAEIWADRSTGGGAGGAGGGGGGEGEGKAEDGRGKQGGGVGHGNAEKATQDLIDNKLKGACNYLRRKAKETSGGSPTSYTFPPPRLHTHDLGSRAMIIAPPNPLDYALAGAHVYTTNMRYVEEVRSDLRRKCRRCGEPGEMNTQMSYTLSNRRGFTVIVEADHRLSFETAMQRKCSHCHATSFDNDAAELLLLELRAPEIAHQQPVSSDQAFGNQRFSKALVDNLAESAMQGVGSKTDSSSASNAAHKAFDEAHFAYLSHVQSYRRHEEGVVGDLAWAFTGHIRRMQVCTLMFGCHPFTCHVCIMLGLAPLFSFCSQLTHNSFAPPRPPSRLSSYRPNSWQNDAMTLRRCSGRSYRP